MENEASRKRGNKWLVAIRLRFPVTPRLMCRLNKTRHFTDEYRDNCCRIKILVVREVLLNIPAEMKLTVLIWSPAQSPSTTPGSTALS